MRQGVAIVSEFKLCAFALLSDSNSTKPNKHEQTEMWNRPLRKSPDEEQGVAEPLYPGMVESPELRWGLIR
jgi:hypothetical protein